ncbi:carboxylesteras-like protein [Lindgomyces ingoldianus]|uniref:Carboxylesteras-like protein n=1 Tax=Lindgomyces ingoldianus TaxID=673940 RepID=A0ACB6QMX2_9PLEO|nr:carboxylesteras-like protein [Lindgomyces ingoldianus]KAF2467467.1 carboxylesteras-like protein [Lindgomyces ingoldianus]
MSTTFEHEHLGQLSGVGIDGTVQFRGLKYASLENRFAPPQLVTSYGIGPTNASKYGPPPVSPPGAVNNEFGFIQHTLPIPDVPTHSDIEGLNLNITVPVGVDGTIDSGAKLPAYVFIHGGGFAVGSSWYPHYNATPLVRISVAKGKPIIGITINYRLGVTGFMTSEELRQAGYKSNNGFHDQRTALEWVKRFIGGFGGDPDEITVCGESAGALSSTMLLLSKEPLMKRCMSTGGAVLLFKPIPLTAAESAYQSVIQAFELADKSPEDRINALLTIPVDELWQKVPRTIPLIPVIDGDTVPGEPNFVTVASQDDDPNFPIPGRKWCASLMIGESQLDANIIAWMGLDARNPGIASKFVESVNKTLSSHPEAASTLLSSYKISESTNDDEAVLSILKFATDISFYAPALAFAKGWPQTKENKFFLYHFNEGNPWEGRFKGEAGHILDVAFLFQNFNEFMNEEQKAVARAYAEDFVEFVNGSDPWPPVEGGKMGARVYGPSSAGISAKYVASGNPEEVGRRTHVLKLGEMAGFDSILDVFQNFFRGG